MIQPNTNTPGDLFSTSNTRAGSGFAAGQSGASNDRPGDFGGFQTKLTAASGLDDSRNRHGSAGGWDPKALLAKASRADAMTKPSRRDGPLQTELKRAMEGNGTKVNFSGSQKAGVSKARNSDALRQGPNADSNRSEEKASTNAAARNDANRPSQLSDNNSDSTGQAASARHRNDDQGEGLQWTPKIGLRPDQTHDAVNADTGVQSQDLNPAQADPSADKQAHERKFSTTNDTETKNDSAAASGDASGSAAAEPASDIDSSEGAEPNGATSSPSGPAPGTQLGKPATGRSAGKAPLPTTINRLNSELLTTDPRRMLLGLDSVGSRLVMCAARVMAGDATGGSVPNPTAAARVEASAANQPASPKPLGASPLGGNGGVAESVAGHNQGLSEFAGDAAVSATTNCDRAHKSDPAGSPEQLPPANANDAATAGTEETATESVRAASRTNSAKTDASTHATFNGSSAGSKEAAKQSSEQPASDRAGSASDPASSNGRADEAQAPNASASAGQGGQSGQQGGQFGQSSNSDFSGKAASNGGQPMPGEQQQASRALAQQVERAVASASRQAERLGGASGPITLRLKPESLGQVRIKLTAGEPGGGLGVKIEVGSTDAQRLLSDSLGSLRDALKAKGLVLEQSTVGVDPSLAPGTSPKAEQLRESAKQAEAERAAGSRAGVREQHGLNGQPHGRDGLGHSASNGSASDHGRGRQDPRSARGGFFDGALLVPGGQRGTRTSA